MKTQPPFKAVVMLQDIPQGSSDLIRKIRRDGIADLDVLLRAAAVEEVVVRERLKTGHFPDGEATALARIVVNEVVAILGNVTRDGGAWAVGDLHSVAIIEISRVPVRVVRSQGARKITTLWRTPEGATKRCGKQVTGEIVGHVAPRLVIRQSFEIRVEDPLTKSRRTGFGQAGLAGRITPG